MKLTILKKDLQTYIQLPILVIGLFSYILNNYGLKTSALIEGIIILNLFSFVILSKKKIVMNKSAFLLGLFSIISIITILVSLLSGNLVIFDIGKEAYRFLMLPALIFSYVLININHKLLMKTIIILIILTMFYTIYEILYTNLISFGNFKGLIFYHAIEVYYRGVIDSQYFLSVHDFGFPFFRPFGIWLQTQKSSFVFPLCMIFLFLYRPFDQKRKFLAKIKTNIPYMILLFMTFLSGGKTAMLAGFIIIIILNANFRSKIQVISFVFLGIFSIVYFILKLNFVATFDSIIVDISAFFNLTLQEQLFGMGFTSASYLLSRNFASESFIFRFIAQIGILSFLVSSLFWLYLFVKPKITKVDLLIFVFIIFATIHYCIISTHFIMIALSIVFSYKLNEKKGC